MELYYINLDFRKDRNEKMLNQLKYIDKIPIKRFSAVLINNFSLLELSNQKFLSNNDYINSLSEQNSFITKGSIGCYKSHLELYKISVETNKILTILEDDIEINSNFQELIFNGLQSINYKFNIIYLGQTFSNWKNNAIDFNDFFWKIKDFYYCTNGYIIHPNYAKFLLKYLSTKYINHIDNAILHINTIFNIDEIYLFKIMLIWDCKFKDSNIRIKRKRFINLTISKKFYFLNNVNVQKQIETWKNTHYNFEIIIKNTKQEILLTLKKTGGFFIGINVYCSYSLDFLIQQNKMVVIDKNNDFFGCTVDYYDKLLNFNEFFNDTNILILPHWILKEKNNNDLTILYYK